MKISICSPSYRRPKVKTLKIIPDLKIYVDKADEEEYKKQNLTANIIVCEDGIQGNVARVRNYILDKEFENGADAVCLVDDDLKGIYCFDVDEQTNFGYVRNEIKDIENFLQEYTEICQDLGFKLWGVNCNSDAISYRHYSPFSFVSVILGPFCVHLKNEIRYDCRLPLKEDYDIALQHLNKYRGILRLNFAHYMCNQSNLVGGCSMQRNMIQEKRQFELLQKKWGNGIVKRDVSNKGRSKKVKSFDYNPIIKVPIKGI